MHAITRRRFLRRLSCAAAAAAAPASLASAAGGRKPLNVVFILIDDLGWTDVGCYGTKVYETPAVDRLATMGMKFTDGYAACTVCSPTRVSVLTGKYPARVNLTDWITGHKRPHAKLRVPDWTMYMKHEEITLAEALKAAGYATGFIGKWHLGNDRKYWPESQGFDVNVGGYSRGQPPSYFSPYRIPTMEDGPKGEYLTDRHAADAERFLQDHRDKPFLLYLSMYAVHTPLQAKDPLIAKYREKIAANPGLPHRNPVYAAMVHSMDECVGRVLDKLRELDLLDNTAVFFTGDNGGLLGPTSNVPLRAGKGSSYEGGVREPFLVYWPGVTRPGSVCREPVTSVDFYPTILEMTGVPGDRKHNADVDGVSLAPLLRGERKSLAREAIYWHYPHYHPGGATPYGAVRAGNLKLIEFYEDMHVELYDLGKDIGESRDLAAEMPDEADRLRKMLHAWRQRVDAQMPTENPSYDPDRAGRRRRGRRAKADRKNLQHAHFDILRGGEAERGGPLAWTLTAGAEGTAMTKLDKPLTGRVEMGVRLKTLRTRDQGWQNGFLAFGDSDKDRDLVCAGLYIGGQKLSVFEGLSQSPDRSEAAVAIGNQDTLDLTVTVETGKRTVTVACAGKKVTHRLSKPLEAVRYVGIHVMQTATAFGEVQVRAR